MLLLTSWFHHPECRHSSDGRLRKGIAIYHLNSALLAVSSICIPIKHGRRRSPVQSAGVHRAVFCQDVDHVGIGCSQGIRIPSIRADKHHRTVSALTNGCSRIIAGIPIVHFHIGFPVNHQNRAAGTAIPNTLFLCFRFRHGRSNNQDTHFSLPLPLP